MNHLKNRIKYYTRWCNILLTAMAITGYTGVLLPLGYMNEGKIKLITLICWGIAGFTLIGLEMLICNRCDRLRLVYERKYDRLMSKQPQVYSLEYDTTKTTQDNEIRSA